VEYSQNTSVLHKRILLHSYRCILSPILFLLVIDFVLRKALNALFVYTVGKWDTSKRFGFCRRYQSVSGDKRHFTRDDYESREEAGKVGLRISVEKTKVMQICADQAVSQLTTNH